MHQPVSLRPDGGICQFMPIRTRPEKWSIDNKTINGVLKWPSNVSNKKEIMPAVFSQTFIFVNPISWHLRRQKMTFLRLIFDIYIYIYFFVGGGGGGSSWKYIETYPALNLVWVLIAEHIWLLHRQTTQTIEEANSRSLLASKS